MNLFRWQNSSLLLLSKMNRCTFTIYDPHYMACQGFFIVFKLYFRTALYYIASLSNNFANSLPVKVRDILKFSIFANPHSSSHQLVSLSSSIPQSMNIRYSIHVCVKRQNRNSEVVKVWHRNLITLFHFHSNILGFNVHNISTTYECSQFPQCYADSDFK